MSWIMLVNPLLWCSHVSISTIHCWLFLDSITVRVDIILLLTTVIFCYMFYDKLQKLLAAEVPVTYCEFCRKILTVHIHKHIYPDKNILTQIHFPWLVNGASPKKRSAWCVHQFELVMYCFILINHNSDNRLYIRCATEPAIETLGD